MSSRAMALPLRAGLTAAFAIAMLAGCGKKDDAGKGAPAPAPAPAPAAQSAAPPPPAKTTDREVVITEIRPEPGTLTAGQSVRMAVSGTYKLPSDGGTVGIVVQDAKNNLIANKMTPVTGSSGSFVQEVEFKVPATDRIHLHVPLYLKGETRSATVTSRDWAVKAK